MDTKRDLIFSLITGFYTGFIAWRIFEFLNIPPPLLLSWAWLMAIIPILWILGVNLGYFLGKWFSFFNQFGKFAAIGFTNAAVDFGILNLLIFYSGIAAGFWFSVFKTVSFAGAMVHSYFWNKYWAFNAAKTEGGSLEFMKFAGVAVLAALVNVGTASIIVNFLGSQFGISLAGWANVGAVVGSAAALVFSFSGFKKFVFKK